MHTAPLVLGGPVARSGQPAIHTSHHRHHHHRQRSRGSTRAMQPSKCSILQRPLRPTSCTRETSEEQYQREQDALAAKGRRQMEHETRLMHTLYPTPEIQQQRHQELEALRAQQVAAQSADRRRAEQQAAAFASRPPSAPAPARPWAGATMAYGSAQEEQAARRALECRLADENKVLAATRALQRQQQREADAQGARALNTEGVSYWNLGAMQESPRFHPPELRWAALAGLKGSGSNPPPAAAAPAAAVPSAAAAAPAAGAAVAAAGSRPGTAQGIVRPPYATHDESGADSTGAFHAQPAGSLRRYSRSGSGGREDAAGSKAGMPAARTRFPWEWDAA